jgi:hypothetical protein
MAWSVAVKVAVQTTAKGLIDGGGAAAYFDIYDASNVLLSTLPLTYPCGAVTGGTGQLVCTFGARDEAAAASGTANHAKLKTSAAVVLEDNIPCQAGSSPVSGKLVLSSLTIAVGAPVEGVSFTIG